MQFQFQRFLHNEQATDDFGAEFASVLVKILKESEQRSVLIFLNGELGAGKTSVVRACLRAMGVEGAIKSPTYTLLEPYALEQGMAKGLKIAHLDLYRLQEPEELDYIGGRDLGIHFNVIFVEWPQKGQGALASPDINIQLNHRDKGRELNMSGSSPFIQEKLKTIKNS